MSSVGVPRARLREIGAHGSHESRSKYAVEVIALTSILLGAAGQLVVKSSLLSLAIHTADLRSLFGILAGLAIYASGTVFWLKAVSRAAISYLYPLSACSYAVVAVGGRLLFGEHIHAGRWVGIAVITVGVAMLAGSRQEVRHDSVDSFRG